MFKFKSRTVFFERTDGKLVELFNMETNQEAIALVRILNRQHRRKLAMMRKLKTEKT